MNKEANNKLTLSLRTNVTGSICMYPLFACNQILAINNINIIKATQIIVGNVYNLSLN